MSSNRNNSYKFIILALTVFLLIVFVKSYKDHKSSSELQSNLKQEALLTQNQLSEIIEKYDSVTMLYNNYDENFSNFNSKNNTSDQLKKDIHLKNEKQLNMLIQNIKDSIKVLQSKLVEIEKIKAKAKPIKAVSVPSHKYSSVDSKFEITNFQVKGVKFLTENAAPTKAKTIEQIRVCFTLDKNDGIPVGKKELFIQVINPKNDIISVEGLTYEKNNTVLKYSKLAKFDYAQQVTDVCSYVDLEKNKTIKGRYIINLYSGTTKISTTLFKYN
jgi:hypothetical protein